MAEAYFSQAMVNRQRLLWTIATRRQLERWEPIVADAVRRAYARRELEAAAIWTAEIEHHFALIAAKNLLRALDLPPASDVRVDPTFRAELKEGRDLHEHWDENLPVFNVHPRVSEPPRPSGKSFATRNPNVGPYDWRHWDGDQGALLLPHVPALVLHELLDSVEGEVLADDPTLARFLPPRAPWPWIHDRGTRWPRPSE